MGGSFPLGDGTRIRLRLARAGDAAAIHRLLSLGKPDPVPLRDPQVGRLVQFHPRDRLVMCAMALIDARETLVGVGSIEVGEENPQPELIVVDPALGPELDELLRAALTGRAGALGRARAA